MRNLPGQRPPETSSLLRPRFLLPGGAVAVLFVSHPILDLVSENPAFLDVHGLRPVGIVLLALLTTAVAALIGAASLAGLVRLVPSRIRLWLLFLSPVLGISPVLFLIQPEIRDRLLVPDAHPAVTVRNPVPVVLLVLDELPLPVLLDAEGNLDAAFPNFARLGSTAHWFPEARSPYATTLPSVPAIATGRYAGEGLIVGDAETCNLFTDLARFYRLDVEERVTRLAHSLLRPGLVQARPPSPFETVARDLGVIYLHWALPEAASGWLPPVDAAWGHFRPEDASAQSTLDELDGDARVARFLAFLDRLEARDAPSLWFFHSSLPHRPWTLLGDDLASQTRAVDQLLGRLLDRLEETGLLESALLVVVADHGLGLTPGAGWRGSPDRRVIFDEILSVPLFVKLPGQTEGVRHDAYVETVDIVPTLAEVLGYRPTCPPDGRSLFGEPRAWEETTFSRHRGWKESRLASSDRLAE